MREPEEAPEGQGAEVDALAAYLQAFRKGWWKIALFSLLVGVVTALVTLSEPNLYQAKAVIAPVGDESKPGPNLGALASFGLSLGTSSRIEDLDILFKSRDLAVRVFTKHDLWPAVLGDRWDAKTGRVRHGAVASLLARITGEPLDPAGKKPTEWDAIRASKKQLTVVTSKKTGTLSVSFESLSGQRSADIVGYYLEEARNRLQEEALERAGLNKRFIEEQIAKAYDPLVRDRLYVMYGQEVEREMMAKNRNQFGFRMVDSPRVPDLKSHPPRTKIVLVAMALAAMAGFFHLMVRRS